MTDELTGDQATIAAATEWIPPADYRWTENVAEFALPPVAVADIVDRVKEILDREHMALPDAESVITRCVTALYVGHLILQGPPGTGKTTLARALAEAFDAELATTTATSEWSPFHVIGGLRPNKDGGLESTLGVVPSTALQCAATAARITDLDDDEEAFSVANWLLIDEFNRADIDKAIGALYTVLSSCDPTHLVRTPLELWFEPLENAQRIWIPASFRIVGTMNDLDTNYVSPMSQGLRRRFQFITVGVPDRPADGTVVSDEMQSAYAAAEAWVARIYDSSATSPASISTLLTVQRVFTSLRYPDGDGVDGWPVGTAQAVDVFRSYLLAATELDSLEAMDLAVADRVIAQMNAITKPQFDSFAQLLQGEGLALSANELTHLYRPYSVS